MSAYNEVFPAEEEVCERCGSSVRRPVQFKFGDTWQHRYSVGDRITWGGNDIGERGHRRVAVMGYPGVCPACGFVPDCTYDIIVEDDVIVCVQPSSGSYDYATNDQTFVVLAL